MSAIDAINSLYGSGSLLSSAPTSTDDTDSSFSDLLSMLQGNQSSGSDSWLDDIIGSSSSSSSGSSWMDALFSADTISTEDGDFLSLDGVYDMFSATFSDFTSLMDGLFASAGVNFGSSSVTLQATGTGSLSSFSENSALSSQSSNVVSGSNTATARFMVTAAFASISYAASNDSAFAADYNDDPAATMEKYEETLKEYLLSFQISFSASGASYNFDSSLDEDSSASATDISDPSSSSVVA